MTGIPIPTRTQPPHRVTQGEHTQQLFSCSRQKSVGCPNSPTRKNHSFRSGPNSCRQSGLIPLMVFYVKGKKPFFTDFFRNFFAPCKSASGSFTAPDSRRSNSWPLKTTLFSHRHAGDVKRRKSAAGTAEAQERSEAATRLLVRKMNKVAWHLRLEFPARLRLRRWTFFLHRMDSFVRCCDKVNRINHRESHPME